MVGISLGFRNISPTERADGVLHLLVGGRLQGLLLELPALDSSLHGLNYEGSRGLPNFKAP